MKFIRLPSLKASPAAQLLVLVLAAAFPHAMSAQVNPLYFGTWKLNLAKSDFGPNQPPQSITATVEQIGEAAKRTIIRVSADGSRRTEVDTVKFDGKDYPHTGSPVYDTHSNKRIDTYTWAQTLKKASKVVATSRQSLSKDGKVYTVSLKMIGANGQSFKVVEVFDRE